MGQIREIRSPLFVTFYEVTLNKGFFRFQLEDTVLFDYESPYLPPNNLFGYVLDSLRTFFHDKVDNFQTFGQNFRSNTGM